MEIVQREKVGRDKNRKNDEYIILERRKKVTELYLQGYPQWKIGELVGANQTTVSLDLKVVRDAWLATAILDWDELKAKELAALDLQLEELWKAWYRSCEVEQVRTRSVKKELRAPVEGKGKDKKVGDPRMTPVERDIKVVDRQLIGDPRYMAEITKIRELRCRILGFLKDEKGAQVNQNTIVIDWEALSKPLVDPIEVRLAEEASKPTSKSLPPSDTP